MAEFLVLGKWLHVQCNELQTLATLEVIIQLFNYVHTVHQTFHSQL